MTEKLFDFLESPENSSARTFSEEGGKDLFVGSLFYGYPTDNGKSPTSSKKLLLDLNILADIRAKVNRNNLRNLFTWAAKNGIEASPLVALSEQQRTHATPKSAYDQYLHVMKEEFDFSISKAEADSNYAIIKSASPKITENTKLQRDYLLIVKWVYHSKLDFNTSIERLADYILKENLPVFTIGLYLGCMYLHVKHHPNLYSAKLVSKIQSDMSISGKHESRLMNVASDLALLQASAEIFYIKSTNEYNYSFIASGDITIHHALAELCWAKMKVNKFGNFGSLAFRPESISGKSINDILERYSVIFSKRDTSAIAQAERKINLRRVADQLYSTLRG